MPFIKHSRIYFLLTGASLALYVVARAIKIPITNDEAYSFYIIKNFWYAEALCTGNTHWLNSAAIWMPVNLGFESEGAIRWLSVLSAMIFFTIVIQWINQMNGTIFKIFVFCLLCLNPYMIDYFSIARGYAPGVMCELLAIHFFIRAEKNPKASRFAAIFFAGLSVLANFSFVYFFLPFSLVYFTRFYFQRGSALREKQFSFDLVYAIVISALTARAYLFLARCSADVFGAGTDSVFSFFEIFPKSFLYNIGFEEKFQLTISAIVFGFIFVAACYGLFQNKKQDPSLYFYCSVIFLGALILMVLNFLIFDLPLPYYRSAIFLFPLAAIPSAFFIDRTIRKSTLKKTILAMLSVMIICCFIKSINLCFVLDFKTQSVVKKCLDHLESNGAGHVALNQELYGCYRNYYQQTKHYRYAFTAEKIPVTNDLESVDRGLLNRADHVVLLPPYDLGLYRNNRIKFESEKYFPETGALILKVIRLP